MTSSFSRMQTLIVVLQKHHVCNNNRRCVERKFVLFSRYKSLNKINIDFALFCDWAQLALVYMLILMLFICVPSQSCRSTVVPSRWYVELWAHDGMWQCVEISRIVLLELSNMNRCQPVNVSLIAYTLGFFHFLRNIFYDGFKELATRKE